MIELKEAYKKVLKKYDSSYRIVEGFETDTFYYFLFIPNNIEFIEDAIFDCVNKETGELSELESRFVYCVELDQESARKVDLRKVIKIKGDE